MNNISKINRPNYKVNNLDDIKNAILSPEISVVSFDVFDTLLLRPLYSPTDVYELLDRDFSAMSDAMLSFKKLRIEAEAMLRRKIIRKELIQDNVILEDININEIYDVLSKEFYIDAEVSKKMMQAEIELEYKLCSARKSTLDLYETAKKANKKIIITSEMYLTKEHISKMLEKCGYADWNNIYVSSDTRKRKITGNLYQYILDNENILPNEILHIGDSMESDILPANELGIKTIFLPKTIEMFKRYGCYSQVEKICADLTNWEAASNSIAIGCMRQMAANMYFDNPFRTFAEESDYNADPYFVGYAALGLELLALHNFIKEQCQKDNIKQIVFMARDGYLPMLAYELCKKYDKTLIPYGYLPISRRSVLPYIVNTKTDLYDLPIDITYQTPRKIVSLLSFCISNEIQDIIKTLPENGDYFGFNVDNSFTKETYVKFISLLINNAYDESKHLKSKKHITDYFLNNINMPITDNCALFDMGYSGRIGAAVMNATGFKLPVYYFHSDARDHYRYEKKSGMKITSFFDFNPYMESSLREYSYLEPAASCIGYTDSLEPIYDQGIAKGYIDSVSAMQKGALDFISEFMEYFSDYPNEIAFRKHDAAMTFEAFLRYCNSYDRKIYENALIDDELWGGRRDINLKELMEIRLRKIPVYAKEKD